MKKDKQISIISKNYANALYSAAETDCGKILTQLEEVIDVLDTSPDLKIVLENSSISTSKKIEITSDIFSGKIDEKLLNFLKVLVEKNRFSEIYSISDAYTQILDKQANNKKVQIISSIELNEKTKNKIIDKLKKKLNCNIIPNWHIDKDIIAGLEFKFDDYVIATSVRSKLKVLSKNISR
ncbi:ATP synthase F1 subunit delta [bacterium]|nr:ATP synthase F1 subunit delta [bacterium]